MSATWCLNGHQKLIKDLSQELKSNIKCVTPCLEENLRRGFVNEGIRLQRYQKETVCLDDVLVFNDGNQIELMKLKLPKRPDFRINKFDLDLSLLHIKLALNLGTIHVNGQYEVNNQSLQQLLPVTFNGMITIDIENVACDGIVGINIKEDSFVVENYDLNFTTRDITTSVIYYNEKSERVQTTTNESAMEKTLARTFWNQLEYKLKEILHRQLGGIIVEYSFSESMLDEEDILIEYRLFANNQRKKANLLLDSFLSVAKTYIVYNYLREVSVVPFKKSFKKPPPSKDMGTFYATDGYIGDLSTLTRVKDFSLYETDEKILVYGTIKMRDFKYGFKKYEAQFQETKFQGDIKTELDSDEIFVKLSIAKLTKNLYANLESIQITNARITAIDLSGLGSLTWLKNKIDSWIIGQLRREAMIALKSAIEKSFRETIPLMDLGDLLDD